MINIFQKFKDGLKKTTSNFSKGIRLTLDWYLRNRTYYKSLSKKDIVNRLGRG